MKKEGTPISGIKEFHNELAEELCIHFANLYTLSLRVKNFHWNVKGPRFIALHQMFEDEYKAIDEQLDDLAERIRALGVYVPASLQELVALSEVGSDQRPYDGDGMLEDLITCYVVVKEHCRKVIKCTELVHDEVTADMLVQHLKIMEKAVWKFRSSVSRASQIAGLVEDREAYHLTESDILGLHGPDSQH